MDKILLRENIHQVVYAIIELEKVVSRGWESARDLIVDMRLKALVPNNNCAERHHMLFEGTKK